MIDWITAGVYSEHVPGRRLPCKVACELDPSTGDLREIRDLSVEVEGSYSDKVRVWLGGRLTERERQEQALSGLGLTGPKVWVSGNPSKWFQGHNVFGSDDLRSLSLWFVLNVLHRVGWKLTPLEERMLFGGALCLSRVDCTGMLDCGYNASVEALVKNLRMFGSVRGERFTWKHNTLGIGYGGRRRQLKLYSKYEEMRNGGKKHDLPDRLDSWDQARLVDYARGCLRAELQLRGPELSDRKLAHSLVWTKETGPGELARALEGVEMPRQVELGGLAVEGLPTWLRVTYQLWANSFRVEELVSRSTFYRHRKELLAYGIDIREAPAGKEFQSLPIGNVVALNPEPVKSFWELYGDRLKGVPDWAIGTRLYYEPVAISG